MFDGDDGSDSSANVPVSNDLDPPWVDGGDDVVEDPVRYVLVEGAFVPVCPEVDLERLEFYAQLVGDVVDDKVCEVRLTCEGAETGEFWSVEGDDVVPAGMRIGERIETKFCFIFFLLILYNRFFIIF